MIALLLVLLGCAPDIHAGYEADRAAALHVVREAAPTSWEPALRVQIPFATLQPVVQQVADTAVRGLDDLRVSPGLGLELRAHPELRVRGLELAPASVCEGSGCLRLQARVDGSVSVNALGVARAVPVSGSLEAQVAFLVEDGRVVLLRLERVARVELEAGGQVARVDLAPLLEQALSRAIQQKFPRFTVADLRDGLPLRAVRVTVAAGGVEIGALSDAPGVEAVDAGTFPTSGLRARAAPSWVLALARRAAFDKGALAMDIVADPRAMSLVGHDLGLDLRLWRLAGRGWWRDYRVKASVAVREARLSITARDATVVGASPRAGLADPLAALAQAQVLTALEDALTRSVGVGRKADAVGVTFAARITDLHGEPGAWVADATFAAREAAR